MEDICAGLDYSRVKIEVESMEGCLVESARLDHLIYIVAITMWNKYYNSKRIE